MDAALKRRLEELGDDECANPVKRQRLDTFENISGVGNDAADMTLNDLGLVDKVLAILAENNGGNDGNGDVAPAPPPAPSPPPAAHDDMDSDTVDVNFDVNAYFNEGGDDGDGKGD